LVKDEWPGYDIRADTGSAIVVYWLSDVSKTYAKN
jgi:hypothetical protein